MLLHTAIIKLINSYNVHEIRKKSQKQVLRRTNVIPKKKKLVKKGHSVKDLDFIDWYKFDNKYWNILLESRKNNSYDEIQNYVTVILLVQGSLIDYFYFWNIF